MHPREKWALATRTPADFEADNYAAAVTRVPARFPAGTVGRLAANSQISATAANTAVGVECHLVVLVLIKEHPGSPRLNDTRLRPTP